FTLMQSIQEAELTFILKPYDLQSGLISDTDLAGAIQQYAIAPENVAIMLITTLRQTADGLRKTVNMRAPVLIDTQRQMAWQHILSSEDYNV
ncbi:flagellar assembly protein FliW, partial [Brachybacterium paraconglomeratum]